MNKIKLTGGPLIVRLALWLTMQGWLTGCIHHNDSTAHEHAEMEFASNTVSTYTCPMHPQVVKNGPGTCPICGMDLVPFDKTNKTEELTLGSSQQALANIATQVIDTGDFPGFTRLNGTLVANPTQTAYISSRVAGRIEKLYIKETGVPVKKGQPLYSIYSEELSTFQQEYLLASAQALNFPDNEKFRQLEKAARQKLLLYGQSASQIEKLLATQTVSPVTTFFAPYSGTVAELSVSEGAYVQGGGAIMLLESYQSLWVEAVVYPAEWNKVKSGQKVKVIIPGYETSPQTMTIQFLAPALEEGTQQIKLRGTLPNPGLRWQPGMQAIVLLPSGGSHKSLSLPTGAVIREGSGAHIWIETRAGVFEPRKVSTGRESSGHVEITEGLKAGEKAVVSGAYLLYSEYVLKKGMHPTATRHSPHDATAGPSLTLTEKSSRPVISNELLNAVYQKYEQLTEALIEEDPARARIAASAIEAGAKAMENGLIANAAIRIIDAKDIADQRAAYSGLSDEVINRIRAAGLSAGKLYVEFCPMAFNDQGGFWLSSSAEIRNPYFGEKMIKCGEVKETLKFP